MLKYEDSENTKADCASTVVLNLHKSNAGLFLGHPVYKSVTYTGQCEIFGLIVLVLSIYCFLLFILKLGSRHQNEACGNPLTLEQNGCQIQILHQILCQNTNF